jgi:hypothetical protein
MQQGTFVEENFLTSFSLIFFKGSESVAPFLTNKMAHERRVYIGTMMLHKSHWEI